MFPHARYYRIDYFCGWRYIFYPAFRKKVKQKWGTSLLSRILCIFGGLFSLVITGALMVFALLAIRYLLTSV